MEIISLSSEMKLPPIGLGTWQANDEVELKAAMRTALDIGYRYFDTAYFYKNEQILGQVVREYIESKKLDRKDLVISTKLHMTFMGSEELVHRGFHKSLEALDLDYIDLYLIHFPCAVKYISDDDLMPQPLKDNFNEDEDCLVTTWKALEKLVDDGKVLSLGVSNFNEEQLERILKISKHPIVCNQIENHIFLQQNDLVKFCDSHDITVIGFAPIGSPGNKFGKGWNEYAPLEHPDVLRIALTHTKTPAQILLKFLIQRNLVIIPKSTNSNRLRENFEIFDFDLSNDEMKNLKSLDKNERSFTMQGTKGHSEYPF